ncbi:alpha/beta hydrolase [Erythrobacter arachoides]|uniref:Alpha/beta hydrolase n=1 Tax=Aurantiacibacter arachoides TaxID=1850444 RepID=A0A844ZWD8_9SPHN|nr:alpha/beta hydrolase [Aurantiacibacter arachoides]MXO92611.1 alpha/beta hydrolase [Aurantiacibacter arachoides]GGD55791.1 alpha/beta hydrolase [Aurantiacibacter arachoides]
MALFEPFPNYVWNLGVSIALENGGKIGEIVDIIEELKEKAGSVEDAGTQDFMRAWVGMADKLTELGEEDLAKAREFSAGNKFKRSAIYYQTGERMQEQGSAGRAETYRKAIDNFMRGMELTGEPVTRVTIPYQGAEIAGLFHKAPVDGPAPCVVYCNGLDSMKEMLWMGGFPTAMAKRGIHTLCVDQPGTGEALRLHDLPATPHSEEWASAWVDWLETRDDVDASRIGMTGISLGGHYAPRAVAYEPRFASGAAWGANHNWREVQDKRINREGENPVPHYWKHVFWVFGAQDMDDFLAKTTDMNLNGHMDRIKVPFLVTHGVEDRQISPDYAQQAYDQLVNSPRRELKWFTPREGGVEHVGADNHAFAIDYIADWFAETLGGRTKA